MASGCWVCGGRALTAGSPQVLPQIPVKSGGPHGAGILGEWLTPFRMPSWEGRAGLTDWGRAAKWECLPEAPVSLLPGVHLEGPFISREKRGAHPEAYLRSFEANAFHDVLATYGSLDNVRIVTLAPELDRSHEVIRALTAQGICVSLGKRPLVLVDCARSSAAAEADLRSPIQGIQWPTCGLPKEPCRVGPPSSHTSSMPCCL